MTIKAIELVNDLRTILTAGEILGNEALRANDLIDKVITCIETTDRQLQQMIDAHNRLAETYQKFKESTSYD